ncbi:AI-2E family transporter [Candidatus Roizmanbacteria bacterium]|nr:AI-2E family transporter [Candidatus Roizmanbacteria bacterium]
MPQRIEISYKTIVFTVLFLLSLAVIFQIRDILFLLMLSFIAASGLRTTIERLERLGIPRVLAILLIYVVLISLLFLLLSVIVPVLLQQTTRLVQKLIEFFSFSFLAPYMNLSVGRIADQLTSLSGNIYRATVGAVGILVNFFTFFVFTFYLLLERRHMRVLLRNFLGEAMKERIVRVVLAIEERLGAWVRGEVSLALIIGTLSYVGLLLLNVDFALPLAIIAGILEVVPIVGPIISAVPAVIVASLISPWLAIAVVALYFLIQQLENHLIVPLVMRKAVGIPPMVSILAILVGTKLAGVTGAILSIPLFVCAQIIFQEFLIMKEEGKISR